MRVEMKYRKALKSDASSMAALSIEVWLGTYLRRGINSFFADFALSEFTAPKFEALLGDRSEFFAVSENDEGIDGFIRITTGNPAPVNGCSNTEISTLYIQPRHHGRGLGKGLLKAGLLHCRENNVQSVWLATNSENTSAINFYLSQGFQNVGKTHFRIQDQAYLNEVFSYELK
mgnify:CR=1 FL=1